MANIEKSQWDSVFGEINEDLRGDFIGFTWDGMSMSRLGIARTSGGNRYNENLLPTMQDKTTQIPGADGTYYFNSFYTQKPFSISFAFDHLTEKGLRQLKQLFGDKGIHKLSFDEQPYKEYMVKVTGQPQLKYIPFDEEKQEGSKSIEYNGENMPNTKEEREKWNNPLYVSQPSKSDERIYKGEGTLTLTAFAPYARSRAKTIEDLYKLGSFVKENGEWVLRKKKDDNGNLVYDKNGEIVYNYLDGEEDVYLIYKNQWQSTSGIKDSLTDGTIIYDQENSENEIRVYNPGDKETDFMLIMEPDTKTPIQLNLYKIPNGSTTNETTDAYLVFVVPEFKKGDAKIRINSKVELIEGLDEKDNVTGNLYNEYISYGWFFKIPQNEDGYYHMIKTDGAEVLEQKNLLSIEYNYWYF